MQVNADHLFSTAHVMANHAQQLRDELQRLVGQWRNLSQGWEGVAAAAYTPAWEEWHEAATKIVDVLIDESDDLGRASSMYHDTDVSSAQALDPRALGL